MSGRPGRIRAGAGEDGGPGGSSGGPGAASERLAVSDLPAPPPGRTGWPWTEGTPPLPATMEDGRPWPRITIVTPSYNQAEFLEMTLRSVLLQGYPNLEYVVVDGGSDDGSVEILERYDPWLDRWTSEPDEGQSDAINKGFAGATGEILAWLNSDDTYYPGALETVARGMEETGADLFLGAMEKWEVDGREERFVKRSRPHVGTRIHPFPILENGASYEFHFYQPALFWRRWLWEETGGLDRRYEYVMDREWCNRALALLPKLETSDEVLARFVLHGESKSRSVPPLFHREAARMYLKLARRPEFRTGACLKAALFEAQVVCALSAGAGRGRGRRTLWRNASRLLKSVRILFPSLERAPNLDGA